MKNTDARNICREREKKKHKTWKACKVFTVTRLVNRLHQLHFWVRIPFFFSILPVRDHWVQWISAEVSITSLQTERRYSLSLSHIICKSENHACNLKPDNFQLLQLLGHANRAQVGTTNTSSRYHSGCGKILSKTQAKPMCNNKCPSSKSTYALKFHSILELWSF